MNSRVMLLRKSRKTKHPDDIAAYKKKKNQANRLVPNFREQLENTEQTSNSFWNILKKLYPRKNSPTYLRLKEN